MIQNSETLAVETALRNWYKAIGEGDMDAVENALTEDFRIVEHTVILDKSALMNHLREAAQFGRQTAELSDFHTCMEGAIAWTTLRNREIWTPFQGEPIPIEFLETAILRKTPEGWRIERYHATLVEPEKP